MSIFLDRRTPSLNFDSFHLGQASVFRAKNHMHILTSAVLSAAVAGSAEQDTPAATNKVSILYYLPNAHI